MQLVCLDLEGVLVPEIWIEFSARTGIPELRRTTRDEPNYDTLMKFRLELLKKHKLGLPDIQKVIAEMGPMEGAKDFLDALRRDFQVIILSDTFYEFANPLMEQLGRPTLFCHFLDVADNGCITGYRLRTSDHKTKSVNALKALNFTVAAAGDSYNDSGMIQAAHVSGFFCAPQNVLDDFPAYPHFTEYAELADYLLNTQPKV